MMSNSILNLIQEIRNCLTQKNFDKLEQEFIDKLNKLKSVFDFKKIYYLNENFKSAQIYYHLENLNLKTDLRTTQDFLVYFNKEGFIKHLLPKIKNFINQLDVSDTLILNSLLEEYIEFMENIVSRSEYLLSNRKLTREEMKNIIILEEHSISEYSIFNPKETPFRTGVGNSWSK